MLCRKKNPRIGYGKINVLKNSRLPQNKTWKFGKPELDKLCQKKILKTENYILIGYSQIK